MHDSTTAHLRQLFRQEADRIDETLARRVAELEEQLELAREIAAGAKRGPRKAIAGQARDAAAAALRDVTRLAADRREALALAAEELAALLHPEGTGGRPSGPSTAG
ncbi:hypothetical protein BX285_4486 [Streptomyces sp. 1114.5]|uniref:hypothetical protein n=1 Tax=unclassified Streptomyces TaxID=2593676 RepID=UPI000BD6DEED|nr:MULTISPECIES: hypothetical protein [unclassified Streptomyces]RKT20008.1 hypothetical protein BX285_4486 [Streptomyces sp. 1114.5]SOB86200.1 hypothetical protein SAMN06272789_6508 [Streptomyces sp. 1331.2]